MIRSFDIFGMRVNFLVKNGNTTYNTLFGSLLSLIVFTVTTCYASVKFNVMHSYGDTYFHEVAKLQNPLTSDYFGFNDGLNMIIMMASDSSMLNWESDFGDYGAL